MTKLQKKIYVLLSCIIIPSYIFTGCDKKNNNNVNPEYSYNIIANTKDLSTEEQIKYNITDIFNISRGYINAWNKFNISYMDIIFDNKINDINKEQFIKQYKKDMSHSHFFVKKYINNIKLLEYQQYMAIIELNIENRLSKYTPKGINIPNKNERIILTVINKENRWVITNIQNK